MLSLVVTVLLIGLAASDPSPPNYRIPTFPINPIAQGGFEHNGLPSSKYHKEQVPVLQQQAVAVPKVQVVTNERVKVVTQTKNVPVPVYKVKEVVKHIPIKKVARVPVMVHNKEYIPVIKKQVNTVVKEDNHVQTKVLHKPVPKPCKLMFVFDSV
ncbi:uncharacterized protein [Argopecten irradians]|uniref:uncharacterized protein n=1 Tax=Argopecten irradians TaxID=31199 RepID=UPI0037233878